MSNEKVKKLIEDEPTELTTQDQVLKDIGVLIKDLVKKITENVEETGEKASFTVKCELGHDKEGNLFLPSVDFSN